MVVSIIAHGDLLMKCYEKIYKKAPSNFAERLIILNND